MAFVKQRRPAPHQIGFEIEVVGDDVCANILVPADRKPPLKLERVPLRQAILLAVRLAHWSGGDVAVIDRHGLWPRDLMTPDIRDRPWSD